MNEALDLARTRLQAFRGRMEADAVIDAESGLTAADLDTILASCQPPSDLEPGGSMDVDDLSGNA
ncbi:hypothetical protein [Sphingomonas sp.]|uniref:hypothetical protein n=1 Tax=Sphingomonas sp. TaxID=28214 RepID=UPI002CD14B46|nr:hypothetical protein [Sphingomonas sp.]HTG39595.1 hypothetical protein [Sphingomonas sp.]